MNRTAVKTDSQVNKLLDETRGMLKGLQTSRRRTAGHLKKDLAQGRNQVRSEVKQMLTDFRRARKGNSNAALTTGNRGKVPVKTAFTADDSLSAKAMTSVNKHPEGITMVAVAGSLGVAPVVLSKIFSGMVSQGWVRKEGRSYFPLVR